MVSSRQLNASNAQKYRGRKMRPRAFRNLIWRSSMMNQHYRSIYSIANQDVQTDNVHGQMKFSAALMLNPLGGTGTLFWTAGGGLRPVNYGGAVPNLSPNAVILRGGMCQSSLSSNPQNVNLIRVTLLIAYSKQQYRSAGGTVPAAGSGGINEWLTTAGLGTYGTLWDPTDEADYSEYFHPPLCKKTMDLRPGDAIDINHRLRCKKIDCDSFVRYGPGLPHIFAVYGQVNNSDGVVETIEWTQSYNLSFSVMDL